MRFTSIANILLVWITLSSVSGWRINSKRISKFFSAGVIGFGISAYSPSVQAIEALDAAFRNNEITYSNNAKNFVRMGNGDYSQGAKDISKAPAALKRRAVRGCKTEKIRVQSGLTEIECMDKTMNGDTKFMLDILSAQNAE